MDGERDECGSDVDGRFSEEFRKYVRWEIEMDEEIEIEMDEIEMDEKEKGEMDGVRYEFRFAKEFRKYVRKENLLCLRRNPEVLLWVSEKEHQPDDGVTSDIQIAYRRFIDKIDSSLKNLVFNLEKFLLQFWRADEVVNSVDDHGERRFQLTTRNQPFLLSNHTFTYNSNQISERMCSYRMKTFDVIVNGDGRGGAIGRVFQNKRMEFTPDVSYYSTEEYPQREIALSCHIKSSLVFPLSDSSGRVVGVIEFVSPSADLLLYMNEFFSSIPGSDRCQGLCGQYDLGKDSLRQAVSEIKNVIEEVCKCCAPEFAQTWMLCKHCNSLSASNLCAQELSPSYGVFSFDVKNPFLEVGCYCLLRKGEGIVGKAATPSHNLVYCEDVAEFSITDYPLAHFARKYNISTCFAICLRSDLTGDHIYVLEFFLSSSYGEHRKLWAKLVPILVKMRQCFQTFKVAYGEEEIGDSVSVQVIGARSPDKVYTLRKGIASFIGADNDRFFNEGRGESSRPYYLQQSIGASSTSETDDSVIGLETSFRDFSMEETVVSSASTVESKFRVTVKANYGDGFIWIPLSASSGIDDLKQQVSQRLQLADGTYNINYLDDDNDPVLLTCDEDLQYYISSSIKHENYSSMVFIEPKYYPMSS